MLAFLDTLHPFYCISCEFNASPTSSVTANFQAEIPDSLTVSVSRIDTPIPRPEHHLLGQK
jgi:hypothetical protein